MAKNAPGKHYRQGITLAELFRKFPDDAAAEQWFASVRWPDGIRCGHEGCGSMNVQVGTTHPSMPYRCRTCRKFFSVKTGTVMHRSKLGAQTWAIAIYLLNTGIKGTSSLKLHRDLGVSQPTAWHLAHRIRETWVDKASVERFAGPVEVDETFVGGKAKNMHAHKRAQLTGRGGVDKTPVVGIRDRATGRIAARVVPSTDAPDLVPFVEGRTTAAAHVFTDGHSAYGALSRHHEVVKHSVGEYVRGMAHTNGIESHWALLKRGYHGTFHHVSAKHLDRYVGEFAGRHNSRRMDTAAQMRSTVRGMVGKRLPYATLVGQPVAGTAVVPDLSEPW